MIRRHLPRAVLAVAVAAVALGLAIVGRAERLSGAEPSLRFQIAVPRAVLDSHPPAALEAIWRARLAGRDVDLGLGPDRGDGTLTLELAVSSVARRDADGIARALTVPGAMALRWIAHDTPLAHRWYTELRDPTLASAPRTVEAVVDRWYAEHTGAEAVDYYLLGPDRATLEASIAAARAALGPTAVVPDDLELMFEDLPARDEPDRQRPAQVRTYLVERATIVTQADVDNAVVAYNPYDHRPEVLLSFTRDGGQRFGDATAAGLGRKLAIVVDGVVVSAPLVTGAIYGGRASINLGGGDARRVEADALGLATALAAGRRTPPLPPGITATLVGAEAATSGRWLTRLGVAALAGLLAWLAAFALARATTLAPVPLVAAADDDDAGAGPGARAVPTSAWATTAVALAVTLGLPALLILASRHVALPGLTLVADELFAGASSSSARSQIGIFALGITPLVSAFWLTELLALVVPSWRRARLGTPADRRTLDRVALALTVGLAGLQAWFVLQYFESLGGRGFTLLADGVLPRLALVATLVAGVLVHLVAANLISRHGLADGVLVLIAAGVIVPLVEHPPSPATGPLATAAALTAAIAVLAAALARLRPRGGDRLPWGGLVPVAVPGVVLALLALPALAWTDAGRVLDDFQDRPLAYDALIAVPVVAVLAWHRRAAWQPLPALLSLGFVVALVLAPGLLDAPYRPALSPLSAALAGVAVLELAAGLVARLRLPALTTIHVVHDVDRADRLGDALAAVGIAHTLAGVHARAVLRMFGAYCPIAIRVAAEDADRATTVLDRARADLDRADLDRR